MVHRLFILLSIIGFCVNSHAETNDLTIIGRVELAVNNPTRTNIIDAYNNIIYYRSFNKDVCCQSFDTIMQSLNDDEIAIELFALPIDDETVEYIAFSVRNQYEAPHISHLFNEDDLNYELEKGEAMYKDTKLASLLLEPLREELIGVKKIYFTPAGKLHLFAIEYCNVEEGVVLGEKYEFYRITSSAMLTHHTDKREHYNYYVIYGGIDFDVLPNYEERYECAPKKFQMGYLQDSYLAALDVHRFFTKEGLQGTLYANGNATEQSFKSLPKNIQIFFIETHGVVSPNHVKTNYPNALMFAGSSYVMEGGVVPEGYEDGLLTTKEVATMDLSSIDLAVISACKSALGDVDWKGINGFMRSFKTAGVNSLVMTTDNVVDHVSGEVWKSFFRNLLHGKNKRESLLNAIKDVRSSHGGFYSSPIFWTPFILIDGID